MICHQVDEVPEKRPKASRSNQARRPGQAASALCPGSHEGDRTTAAYRESGVVSLMRLARRNTKRGSDKTDLTGEFDVLICGASFAGLAAASMLRGTDARVLVIDRYEIGERQTSACAIPTAWLENLDLLESECQRFDTVVVHTPHGRIDMPVPWQFSTFDYRALCDLLWARADAVFETAKVEGPARTASEGPVSVETDRGTITADLVVDALGWRRVLDPASSFQPPEGPLSRGLEVHPAGTSPDLEVWIDRDYVPAGYGWSFPAGDELRVGVGSFDPRYHVRKPTEQLADDLGLDTEGWQGNWIPHRLREATSGPIFFAGDSAGHCLPLTAEGIRPALYFGLALGIELRAVLEGRQSRERALDAYHRFNESHRPHFEGMLAAQRALPRIEPRLLKPMLSAFGNRRFSSWAFGRYLDIAPPAFATILDRAGNPVTTNARV